MQGPIFQRSSFFVPTLVYLLIMLVILVISMIRNGKK